MSARSKSGGTGAASTAQRVPDGPRFPRRSVRAETPPAARPAEPTVANRGGLAALPSPVASTRDELAPSRESAFVDLLTPRRQFVLRALGTLWFTSIVAAIAWWIGAARPESGASMAFNSAILAFDAVVLPGWFLFFSGRMRKPRARRPVSHLRVAMVVTKAPTEPWPVVRETLAAMLEQDFPHSYDVWLADEDPDRLTEAWCVAHGVGVCTRRGVPGYHRRSWPRRAKCKEGNLAYFYDAVGYARYDVVAQLDADHVPARDYLANITAPFADPSVGYVAAPSVCDRNASRSWSARGRLYSEALIHGAMQAGSNGRWVPCCIGSHYAVRTAALKQIGGLGPELAEDFSTTLLMTSHGWEGVFAIDAEAHGDGPETLSDCVTQDFQWSRSMMMLGLTIGLPELRRASWRGRIKLGFCLAWYPMYGLTMLASVALPAVALLTGVSPVHVRLDAFYAHLLPTLAILVAIAYWLRHCGALRPRDAKVVGWEIVLFQLVRWPWALLGCLHALVGWVTRKDFTFKVTPKGTEESQPLSFRVVAPFLAVAALSGLPALLVHDPGSAGGYYVLALANASIYLAVALAVVLLHVHEQPRVKRRVALRLAVPNAVALCAACALVLAAMVVNGPTAVQALTAPAPAGPWPTAADPGARVAVGVITDAGARNVAVGWNPGQQQQVNDFERLARVHAGIVMWFTDWAHGHIDPRQLEAVGARGSVPEISWEPWDHTLGPHHFQTGYSLASIAAGRHDAYIRRSARTLRQYGRPVLLRFAQEMNADAYPWGHVRRNNRGDYVAAWRHVHDVFEEVGARNVRWVWSPVARPILAEQYPGGDYVDVVGLSGFNGGTDLPWSGWRSFSQMFSPYLARLRQLAPGKPIQISEVSSAEGGGSKAEWIRSMFDTLRAHPEVRSLVWFDVDKEADWRLASSPAARDAFSSGMRDRRYGGRPTLPGPSAPTTPDTALAAVAGGHFKLGVTTLKLAENSFRTWSPKDLAGVRAFERDARHHADTVMWFADWEHVARFDAGQARLIASRGSVPEISWEPWDSFKGPRVPQPRYRLARIIRGSFDPYIRRWARELAAYGKPVRLRFAHEMNAKAYPWAERTNGNRAGEFARAWRHVHGIFRAAGAKNVRWVWAPVAGRIAPGLFPGRHQVDVLGLSGFNGGPKVFRKSWRPFKIAFSPRLDALHRLAPRLPVELSEIGSVEEGGSKATWIRDMFSELRRRRYVRSLVWFNIRKEADWRIESSPSARRAFARGINRASR